MARIYEHVANPGAPWVHTFSLACSAMLLMLVGCRGVGSPVTLNPFHEEHIPDIELGRTTFSQVLEWFGPPDAIIDGRQEIAEADLSRLWICPWESSRGVMPNKRTLSAPEGQVILLYRELEITSKASGVVVAWAWRSRMEFHTDTATRPKDLLIYLSKDRRIVTDVASSIRPAGVADDGVAGGDS